MNLTAAPTTHLHRKATSLKAGLALGLLAAAAQVAASVYSVSPVRIYMSSRDRAVAVTINNEGTNPVALQADLYEWSQKPDGTDELVLTEDMVMAPPILKIAPKSKQVLRVARLSPPDLSKQLTYRLIVREIPEVAAAKEGTLVLPIALAFSMPVFLTPANVARNMACDVAREQLKEDTVLSARCGNTGTAYAQVREVLLERGGKTLARFEGGSYILPGAKKSLQLSHPEKVTEAGATPAPVFVASAVPAGPATIKVSFDDGKSQTFDVQVP